MPVHPQLVDEAVLQGAVDALAAPAGRRRVGEDMVDAQAGQGAADLGQASAIGAAAGHRGVHGPMGAVGVQRHRYALRLKDGA